LSCARARRGGLWPLVARVARQRQDARPRAASVAAFGWRAVPARIVVLPPQPGTRLLLAAVLRASARGGGLAVERPYRRGVERNAAGRRCADAASGPGHRARSVQGDTAR